MFLNEHAPLRAIPMFRANAGVMCQIYSLQQYIEKVAFQDSSLFIPMKIAHLSDKGIMIIVLLCS